MTTAGTLVTRLTEELRLNRSMALMTLNGAIADGSTTSVTVDAAIDGVDAGSVLQVDTEQLYVRSVSTNTYTVIRGWNSSPASGHSDGAIVEVDPIVPKSYLLALIDEEILSWPRTLYKITALEVTFEAKAWAVDITSASDVWRLLKVTLKPSATDKPHRDISHMCTVERNMNTGDFASGFALQFAEQMPQSGTVRILYAGPFTTGSTGEFTDLESTVGLSSGMLDIVKYGIAARALDKAEIVRASLETQSVARKAEELPPGYLAQVAATMQMKRDQRITEEAAKLSYHNIWRY